MPAILFIYGWKFFFFSNENNEPIHIHVKKAESEAKFWINEEEFEIKEAFTYGMSPSQKREVRKLIFEHFDYIVKQWKKLQKK